MTYQECYKKGCACLEAAGIEEAALDARLLLEFVCGTDRNHLLVHGERPVEEDMACVYEELLLKRAERVPLQYLTGVQEFMGLEFQVDGRVLIPRQDTEILVEEVLRRLQDGSRILDMCTGSGCILISLLHYSNGCTGTGADISEEALQVAGENAVRNQVQAQFVQSDLFENISGKYEIIVSNPPYIKREVLPTLMPEVREHEPIGALDGFEDGLYFYRRVIAKSRNFLVGGGMLYLEIGWDQAEEVTALMEENGFRDIETVKDYAGLDRVVFGTWQ